MSTLNVFWDTELVGRLIRKGKTEMSFQYSETFLSAENLQSISLSLPLQQEAFSGPLSGSWFANLLPEGEIRGHIARVLGVSEGNDYALRCWRLFFRKVNYDFHWRAPRTNFLFTSMKEIFPCPVEIPSVPICLKFQMTAFRILYRTNFLYETCTKSRLECSSCGNGRYRNSCASD